MAGIFMDSGAFSAFTRKAEVNLEEYIAFLQEYKDKLDVYCCLDVIGDVEATWKNFERMLAAGLHPLPVYHVGEDVKYLHRCLEYDYFCLGGMAKDASAKLRVPFLDKAFTIICDKDGIPKSKVHGLGMTSFELMRRYPFYSVDSTSWVLSAGMGSIFLPSRGKDTKYDFSGRPHVLSFSDRKTNNELGKHFDTCSKDYQEWIVEYLDYKGFTLEGIRASYKDRRAINVEYLMEFQKTMPEWPWPFKKFRSNYFH